MDIESIMKQDGKYVLARTDAFKRDQGRTVTLDYDENMLRLSSGCLKALGKPEYVTFMINPQEKMFGLTGTKKKSGFSAKVKKNDLGGCSLKAGMFLEKVAAMMEWDTEQYSKMKLYGGVMIQIPEEPAELAVKERRRRKMLSYREIRAKNGSMVMFKLTEAVLFRRTA